MRVPAPQVCTCICVCVHVCVCACVCLVHAYACVYVHAPPLHLARTPPRRSPVDPGRPSVVSCSRAPGEPPCRQT
jgi:hypothetical protein